MAALTNLCLPLKMTNEPDDDCTKNMAASKRIRKTEFSSKRYLKNTLKNLGHFPAAATTESNGEAKEPPCLTEGLTQSWLCGFSWFQTSEVQHESPISTATSNDQIRA